MVMVAWMVLGGVAGTVTWLLFGDALECTRLMYHCIAACG